MQAACLDGLLMFRQESMYYLTGYDTFGFVFFQCLYLGADDRLEQVARNRGCVLELAGREVRGVAGQVGDLEQSGLGCGGHGENDGPWSRSNVKG